MFHFVLYSNTGRTDGKFNPNKLKDAGRLDIVVHSIIHSLFISECIRTDITLHLFLYGKPDPPKYIKIESNKDIPFSKKDIGTLLKIILHKYKKGKIVRVFPGVFIQKKEFEEFVEENEKNLRFVWMDRRGKDIEEFMMEVKNEELGFIFGDHLGLPKYVKSFLRKKKIDRVSLGSVEYFTSQCVTIVNYFLDKKFKRKIESFTL